jgi:hypothetical protein
MPGPTRRPKPAYSAIEQRILDDGQALLDELQRGVKYRLTYVAIEGTPECGGREVTRIIGEVPVRSLAEQILGVVLRTDRPLKGDTIARRLGRTSDSYFRGCLAQLVRDKKIRKLEKGGYLPPLKAAS